MFAGVSFKTKMQPECTKSNFYVHIIPVICFPVDFVKFLKKPLRTPKILWSIYVQGPEYSVQSPVSSVQSPASNSCVQSPEIPVCLIWDNICQTYDERLFFLFVVVRFIQTYRNSWTLGASVGRWTHSMLDVVPSDCFRTKSEASFWFCLIRLLKILWVRISKDLMVTLAL